VRPPTLYPILLALSVIGFVSAASYAAPAVAPDVIVAADGSGDFTTVQAAVAALPRDNHERRIIFIKRGVYHEKVRIDANDVTLEGENRGDTRIEFPQGATEFRAKPDGLGTAVLNINGNDCVVENLTIQNTHGVVGVHAFAVYGRGDRTVIQDCDILSEGNDTLSLWRTGDRQFGEGSATNDGTQPNGRYYHARLRVRGSVDFICPRGWCYLKDSDIFEVNPRAEAAIWHDGSRDPRMKFVLRGCRFDGVEGWQLARHHHDAQIFLLDCTFSATMRDTAPHRVVYPLGGKPATDADRKRNAELDATNIWGERFYSWNCHRAGGNFAWFRDNLSSAAGAPRPADVTAAWTFDGTWNPEDTSGPRIVKIEAGKDRVTVTFSESVTVKGHPLARATDGTNATYVTGSGSNELVFALNSPRAKPVAVREIDLHGGAIVATNAAATLRFAQINLPWPMRIHHPAIRALAVSAALLVVRGVVAAPASLPAFPGAEGFGATTPGGRGGRVIFVTNLNDAGEGSLRAACEAEGARIVVFRVSGTIALKSPLVIKNPYLTLAGQTAPGEGICVRDHTFGVQTHDVIIRFLRSRLGDVTAQESDCIDLLHGAHDVIVDHCSATWSIDECLSLSGNVQNCTVQWCLIGESLNASKHHKGPHGFGSLSRANGPISWHHNLWIDNNARNPRLGDNYGRAPYPTFDVRNNIVYDFGGTASGLTQGRLHVNYVANYLRRGPSSTAATPITVSAPSDLQFYIRDNVYDGDEALTKDNTGFFGAVVEKNGRRTVTKGAANLPDIVHIVNEPFAAPAVHTVPANEAVDLVLASVGASTPKRDAVDARLVAQVRDRSGRLIDSQEQVGGWPTLASTPAPADSDNDGIPDAWEAAHGLNGRDAADANADRDADGYTNIEEYLNSVVAKT
jgi:hypothetical protein